MASCYQKGCIPLFIASIIIKNKSSECNNDNKKTILGLGFAGIDYIATVASYPLPDEKIRTLSLSYTGGGNCGNTMSSIGILGSSLFPTHTNNVRSKIITKIADDSNGNFVKKGLEDNHIDISDIVISPSPSQTGFVYVIVDNETKTRTCLATLPNAEITDDEINNKLKANILKDINLIHFDSRHTQAAAKVASLASSLSIPMSLDLEKDRPYLRKLLPYCNIVFTNEHAVQKLFSNINVNNHTGDIKVVGNNVNNDNIMTEEELLQRVSLMVYSFSNDNIIDSKVHTVISTLGSLGSILIKRKKSSSNSNSLLSMKSNDNEISDLQNLLSNCGIRIKHYEYYPNNRNDEIYEVLTCSSIKLSPDDIVDTTGAGDSYQGAFLVGYVTGLSLDECMKIGTLMASKVIQKEGARSGIMSGQQLRQMLTETYKKK